MLEVDVKHSIGGGAAGVSLEVEAGETVALAGVSGAGKTTLLRTIAGVQRADSGRIACGAEVWFDSEEGIDLPPEQRGCGVVFQTGGLFPRMSALGNVAFGVRAAGRAERRRRARTALERFGLGHRVDARPATMSGGEQRRLALARTLAADPRALLFDEPLASLDPANRAAAIRIVTTALGESGVPAIVVTHDFGEAAALSDRVAILEGGRIVQQGTPHEIAASPATEFVAGFAGLNLLPGTVVPGGGAMTFVRLADGTVIRSTDAAAEGPATATIHPWEVTLQAAGDAVEGSALNTLDGTIEGLQRLGARCRISLGSPVPLVAEVSSESADRLALAAGSLVRAKWKATATRIIEASTRAGAA